MGQEVARANLRVTIAQNGIMANNNWVTKSLVRIRLTGKYRALNDMLWMKYCLTIELEKRSRLTLLRLIIWLSAFMYYYQISRVVISHQLWVTSNKPDSLRALRSSQLKITKITKNCKKKIFDFPQILQTKYVIINTYWIGENLKYFKWY